VHSKIWKIGLAAASVMLMTSPAWALPSNVPSNSGTAHMPSGLPHSGTDNPGTATSERTTPGPNASLPAKARAYGRQCQGESRKHVAGTPGTPFSQCVTALAKLANGSTTNPRTACVTESRKHVAGTPGTPFSRCVSAGAQLLRDENSST
jgi:hypothetical protein